MSSRVASVMRRGLGQKRSAVHDPVPDAREAVEGHTVPRQPVEHGLEGGGMVRQVERLCVFREPQTRRVPPMPSATPPERRWFRSMSNSVSLIEDDPAFRTRSVSRMAAPSHQASQEAQNREDREQDEGEFLEVLGVRGGEAPPPDPEPERHEGRHRGENDETLRAEQARSTRATAAR